MERVNHVDILKVGRCCFICKVYGMLKRKIPDRECLVLGISGFYASFILMIKLRETCSHLARSGSRCSDYDKGTCGFNIFVLSKSVIAYDKRNIGRIACDRIMSVDLKAERFELFLISHCAGL